jgi:hypothetical protein
LRKEVKFNRPDTRENRWCFINFSDAPSIFISIKALLQKAIVDRHILSGDRMQICKKMADERIYLVNVISLPELLFFTYYFYSCLDRLFFLFFVNYY